jgi:osmotically-inducible protein OsmY
VTRVTNLLEGVPGSAPGKPAAGRTLGESLDDQSLEMQVRLALSLKRGLKGSDLTVQVYRLAVTLGGEVASPEQRELALATTRDTAAVGSVVDQIHVRGTS